MGGQVWEGRPGRAGAVGVLAKQGPGSGPSDSAGLVDGVGRGLRMGVGFVCRRRVAL